MKKIDLPLIYKSCDEAVYEYTEDNLETIQGVIDNSSYSDILRIETFHLSEINNGFIELHYDEDGTVVFKGIPSELFCETFANYYGYAILDYYKVFEHQKRLCQRIE